VVGLLERRPGDARARVQLVRLHRALGDLEAAQEACTEYLRLHGANDEIRRFKYFLDEEPGAGSRVGIAGPAPFVRLANVLSPADQAAVWSLLEGASGALAPATVRWHGGEGVIGEIRHSLRMTCPERALDRLLPALRTAIEGRGLPEAFGLARPPSGSVESEVVCHMEGGHFGRHSDNAYGDSGRLLTCVYYLHRKPARFTGGDLLLHDAQSPEGPRSPIAFTRFAPDDNTALIFPADVGHEVTGVRSGVNDPLEGRVSINIWFHGPRVPDAAPS